MPTAAETLIARLQADCTAAEAAERRRVRRLTKPRTPFAYIAVTIGIAVIAGTLVALQQNGTLAPALGLFVAGLVLAVAMVVAGAVRRRSGFIAFVTVLTFKDDEFRQGIEQETGQRPEWAAEAFPDVDADVRQSIVRIKNSPFVPHRDKIRGFVYHVENGTLREIDPA